jgi:hypothetical protein
MKYQTPITVVSNAQHAKPRSERDVGTIFEGGKAKERQEGGLYFCRGSVFDSGAR